MHQDVFISMVRGIQGIAASSLAVASGSMIWGSSQSEKSDDRGCLNVSTETIRGSSRVSLCFACTSGSGRNMRQQTSDLTPRLHG